MQPEKLEKMQYELDKVIQKFGPTPEEFGAVAAKIVFSFGALNGMVNTLENLSPAERRHKYGCIGEPPKAAKAGK